MSRLTLMDHDGLAVDFADYLTVLNSLLSVLSGTLITTLSDDNTPDVFVAINAISAASEVTLWTPASGKKFKLLGGIISYTGAASNVRLKDGNAGSTIFTLPNTLLSTPFQFNIPGGITSGKINNTLRAIGTTLQFLNGTLYGKEVT